MITLTYLVNEDSSINRILPNPCQSEAQQSVLDKWTGTKIDKEFDVASIQEVPFPYNKKSYILEADGAITPNAEKIAEKEAQDEEARKDSITNGAFTQQNAICDENMRLFFFPLFTNPLLDWTALPKLSCYKVFMEELWAERDIRKEGTSTDSDFSAIVPTAEYSFNELMAELQSI